MARRHEQLRIQGPSQPEGLSRACSELRPPERDKNVQPHLRRASPRRGHSCPCRVRRRERLLRATSGVLQSRARGEQLDCGMHGLCVYWSCPEELLFHPMRLRNNRTKAFPNTPRRSPRRLRTWAKSSAATCSPASRQRRPSPLLSALLGERKKCTTATSPLLKAEGRVVLASGSNLLLFL